MQYPAILVWGLYAFWVAVGLTGLSYKPKKTEIKYKNIEFAIVSIANKGVKNALFECITHHLKFFREYKIYLVVDEGADLIDEIIHSKSLFSSKSPISPADESYTNKFVKITTKATTANIADNFSIVIVPSAYRKDLVGKGRAINYFIDTKVRKGKWYSLIDDDNLILDDNFLYEIHHYDKRGYTMTNPTITPRLGKSKFTYVMDFVRRYDDKTLSRLFTGRFKAPILGAHGEMLTVKGDVLKDIGFSFRTITEDFRFGIEFVRRKNKAWQSSTIVSVKSANSIKDLFKQRGRWYKGIVKDLKYAPPLMRAIVSVRIFLWTIGIFGTWVFSPLWFLWNATWAAIFIFGGMIPWFVFIYYIIKTKQPLYYLLMIPMFGIVESISFVTGLKHKKFVVIDKN